MNRLNRYIVAVLLLLNFTQGIGMRLWMHHWFHESSSTSTAVATVDAQMKCDCLHDATMPMRDAPSFELALLPSIVLPLPICRNVAVASLDEIFCSLKGPPAGC